MGTGLYRQQPRGIPRRGGCDTASRWMEPCPLERCAGSPSVMVGVSYDA
jgi:hypothetical protein